MSRPAGSLPPHRGRSELASPGDRAATCPRGAPMLRALDALLSECLRTGASRLHVEIDPLGVRARLRRDGTLESRRLDLIGGAPAVEALDAALADCLASAPEDPAASDTSARDTSARGTSARGTFVCAVGGDAVPVRVSYTRIGGPERDSTVLELVPWTTQAPTLDELVAEPRELAALRAALAAGPGLILLHGTEPAVLAELADAVAQQCVAPDRKVVQACAAMHRTLPGVVQLQSGSDGRECADALLGQDADVVLIDDSLGREALVSVTERAATRALVVRTVIGGAPIDALRTLGAEGTGPGWLAHRLRAVVRLDRLRTLCPHCRRPLDLEADALSGTGSALLSPLSRALSSSLQRFCEAPGCERCEGTGIERSAYAIETLPVADAIAAALADGAVADAAQALDAARRLPRRARELARRGLVSIAEANRLDGR